MQNTADDYEYQYWLGKVQKDGMQLRDAPKWLKSDRTIVITAVKQNGAAFEYASVEIQSDKYIASVAARNVDLTAKNRVGMLPDPGKVAQFVGPAFTGKLNENIPQFRSAAVVPPGLQNNKFFVSAAVEQDGWNLGSASPSLKRDKDVALAAINQDPSSIKFVHEQVQRDPEVLIAAGMFDKDPDVDVERRKATTKKIVFSTRFSLNPTTYSDATTFTKFFKDHEYIKNGNFKVYSPNAFDKQTCDPKWTDFDHPCRGTKETCQFVDRLKTGHPTNECCWRYSFRCQLEEAKESVGFMLQLIECVERSEKEPELGDGQRIEQDMAKDLKLKTFQVYSPRDKDGNELRFHMHHVENVIAEIKNWYGEGCKNMDEVVVYPAAISPLILKQCSGGWWKESQNSSSLTPRRPSLLLEPNQAQGFYDTANKQAISS